METATVKLFTITGKEIDALPQRKVVVQAQRALCMCSSFWTRIVLGKFPYIIDSKSGELIEADYNDVSPNISRSAGVIYWIKDIDLEKFRGVAKELWKTKQDSMKLNEQLAEVTS